MNSAFEGLRPMVGLRRPGRCLLRRRRPTLGAERPERPISIGGRAFGRRSACAPNEFGLRRPSADGRPAPTEKDILCVGGGRRLVRSARRGRFQSAGKPSAIGRPAPTGEVSSASAEADAWRGAPGEADFNRRERPSANGRPAPTGKGSCVGGGRRLAWSAWRGRFQSAGGPSADGRPAPTGKVSSASAEADAWRGAPEKADFNRRESDEEALCRSCDWMRVTCWPWR
jgi:hypothetical protein